MSKPITVSDAGFDEQVVKADLPVLVDFWAPWCGPCKMIAPILEQVAGEYDSKITIAKLDVDENPQVAQKFGVMSIPTMILFKGGQPVERLVGYMPKGNLLKALTPHL
jgi:thioredoxin 1